MLVPQTLLLYGSNNATRFGVGTNKERNLFRGPRLTVETNRQHLESCLLTESFCEKVSSHLKYVARKRLHTLVRPHLDSIDVTQMVWKSFLQHDQTRFTDWDKKRLRGYLEQVLDNKLKEIHRRYLSYQIRNVRRNEKETDEILENHTVPEEPLKHHLTDTDNWRRMCAALTHTERRVLLLRIQGRKLHQISDELELHRRSVQKIMLRVRKKFVETNAD